MELYTSFRQYPDRQNVSLTQYTERKV